MMLVHKSQLFVNEVVSLSYAGKLRKGQVVEVTPKWVLVDMGEDKPPRERFRRFCWDSIEGATDTETGVTIVERNYMSISLNLLLDYICRP